VPGSRPLRTWLALSLEACLALGLFLKIYRILQAQQAPLDGFMDILCERSACGGSSA